MRFFKIDKVIQWEGLYVCNMRSIAEKHFSISIATVRSRGGSLVKYKISIVENCVPVLGNN
jgi:hypothetical protein